MRQFDRGNIVTCWIHNYCALRLLITTDTLATDRHFSWKVAIGLLCSGDLYIIVHPPCLYTLMHTQTSMHKLSQSVHSTMLNQAHYSNIPHPTCAKVSIAHNDQWPLRPTDKKWVCVCVCDLLSCRRRKWTLVILIRAVQPWPPEPKKDEATEVEQRTNLTDVEEWLFKPILNTRTHTRNLYTSFGK